MRAVVQRVSRASVTVDGTVVGAIEMGLMVLIGVGHDDDTTSAEALAHKILGLRIFEDDTGRMNLDVQAVGGDVLAISQFTLYGDCRKGRRPSFVAAGRPEHASPLFDHVVHTFRQHGLTCPTGVFGAMMDVELINHGPVTLLLDTDKTF
ncbi:MAG: D-aminoacyl-tRNA deacylase [Myxococcota bacterium]